MSDTVSVRKYLKSRIKGLSSRVDSLEESNLRALNLQAAETQRRLDDLNGEAGRITKVLEASIPREVHERDIKELRGLIDGLTKVKDVDKGKSTQTGVIAALILSLLGLLIGAISLVKAVH